MIRERFAHFEIAQDEDGRPIGLPGTHGEMVSLAYDLLRRRLVELHLFEASHGVDVDVARFNKGVLRLARLGVSPCYPAVLEGGERHGILYLSCDIRGSEPLGAYRARSGGLPSEWVARLGLELVDGVLALAWRDPGLLAGFRFDAIGVHVDGAHRLHLSLGAFDPLRLDRPSLAPVNPASELREGLRRLALNDAVPFLGDITDDSTAGDCVDDPQALQRLRDELESFLSTLPQARREEGRVGLEQDGRRPVSPLVALLGTEGGVPRLAGDTVVACRWKDLLAGAAAGELLLQEKRSGQLRSGRLLPPGRVLESRHLGNLAPGSTAPWVTESANILATAGCWIGDEGGLVAEEHCPGYPLEQVWLERGALQPAEIVLLVEDIASGLAQADQLGVEIVSLHPSTIVLQAPGMSPGEEFDALMTIALWQWPTLALKLRSHPIIQSLVARPPGEHFLPAGTTAEQRSYRQRMVLDLLCLTELLCGGRDMELSNSPVFRAFIRRQIEEEIEIAGSVEIESFLEGLRAALGEQATRKRSSAGPCVVPSEPRGVVPVWRREEEGICATQPEVAGPVVTEDSAAPAGTLVETPGVQERESFARAGISTPGPARASSRRGFEPASKAPETAPVAVRKRARTLGRFLEDLPVLGRPEQGSGAGPVAVSSPFKPGARKVPLSPPGAQPGEQAGGVFGETGERDSEEYPVRSSGALLGGLVLLALAVIAVAAIAVIRLTAGPRNMMPGGMDSGEGLPTEMVLTPLIPAGDVASSNESSEEAQSPIEEPADEELLLPGGGKQPSNGSEIAKLQADAPEQPRAETAIIRPPAVPTETRRALPLE